MPRRQSCFFRHGDFGFALLSIDLDRFKEVNDSYGRHVGDELLARVAERMRSVVGADTHVARFGGTNSPFDAVA